MSITLRTIKTTFVTDDADARGYALAETPSEHYAYNIKALQQAVHAGTPNKSYTLADGKADMYCVNDADGDSACVVVGQTNCGKSFTYGALTNEATYHLTEVSTLEELANVVPIVSHSPAELLKMINE